MVSLLTIERMHNTRLGRLQKLHPLTHTEEGFRGREEKSVPGLQRVTVLNMTSPRSSGLTAGTHLPNLQGGKTKSEIRSSPDCSVAGLAPSEQTWEEWKARLGEGSFRSLLQRGPQYGCWAVLLESGHCGGASC